MRDNFTADWAFAISGSIEKTVERSFPQELRTWPLITAFNFEAFIFHLPFMIIILRDKLSGIPAGPSIPSAIDLNDCPESPSAVNVLEWQHYLQKKFTLRPQDAAVIISIEQSSKTVEQDWELWIPDMRDMWHKQIEMIVSRQYFNIKGVDNMGDFLLPPGYQFLHEECSRFFNDHPDYNKNIFIMTRFSPGNRLLEKLDHLIREVLRRHGFNPLRADDKMYMRDRNLWNNVCVYMHCSKYGIAILEDRISDEFNPNVALEYGFMRALNKPTLLLADVGFRNLRADVIGTLRETFDITDMESTLNTPIETWLRELELI